jgi:cytochrome c-type biogenesis protein CcmF
MTPELGNVALILALGLASMLGVLPIWGAYKGDARWMALARPLAVGQFVFVALAFGILLNAFVGNDFSVAYVAGNSNSLLPVYYRVAGAWGGHEGSLLLWQLMLTGWTLAVARFSRSLPDATVARVLGVLGLISVGFLSFTLFTSNPFERVLPAPPDGRDLNPLLQDFGMIIHPPLLYMGYVGFSVAFAFAIAALLAGELDAAWAKWSRPWTLLAWACLTLGILLGSFWAYYELGWGGWWFWDAVENASFMPWLVGTALVHSLSVTEKRGSFKNWTVLLAILAFSLSLLGTFLVRSGVLTSVHAFASDPRRGLYILVFLLTVIGGSLSLYAWRAPKVGLGGRFALFSRESLLLVNNVFLLVSAGTVLLGTLYPLALDAFGLGKISVGPPYFEAVFVPLMLPVLVAMGVGPFVAWKQGQPARAWRDLRGVALVTLLLAGALAVAVHSSVGVALGLLLALWITLSSLQHARQRLQAGSDRAGLAQRWRAVPLAFWGMVVAHVGVGVFVLGVTLVKGLDHAQDASLKEGSSVSAGGYDFQFKSLQKRKGPNYIAGTATFEVTRAGQHVVTLHPEKRFYVVQRMPMTEAAIDRGLTRDLYVSLGEASADGAWGVRVQVKPFMGWVWAGCLVMALGGLLAASDKRYRQRARVGQVQGIERTSDQLGAQAPSGNCLPFRQPGEQPTNGSSGLAGSPLNSVRGAL